MAVTYGFDHVHLNAADVEAAASFYEEVFGNGHLLLRGVTSTDEIAACRPAIVDAAMRHNQEIRPLDERDTYGKAFLQIMNLGEKDAVVRRFTRARRSLMPALRWSIHMQRRSDHGIGMGVLGQPA